MIPSRPCRVMQGESEKNMLEARSAYGYYGAAGGYTGERVPADSNVIYKNMKYYEYKAKYPECKTLGDYDKIEKTITVILPAEYADRPNFGNHYQIREFHFVYSPMEKDIAGRITPTALFLTSLQFFLPIFLIHICHLPDVAHNNFPFFLTISIACELLNHSMYPRHKVL